MGRIETAQYIRKPLFVDAVRVTNDNFEEIANWCQGEILQDEVPGKGTGKKYVRIRVHNPKNPRQTKAFVGDWILYTERGYKVYTNKAFNLSFDEVEGTVEDRSYPYEEGDVVVIGPQCFAQPDGEVLNWKGTNYVPQSSGLSIEEAQAAARAAGEAEETLFGGETVKYDASIAQDHEFLGAQVQQAIEKVR